MIVGIGTHSINVINVVLSMTGIRCDVKRCVRYVQEVRAKQDETKTGRISSFRKYVDQAVSKCSIKAVDEEVFLE